MKQVLIVIVLYFSLLAGVQAGDKAGEGIWIDVRTVAEYQRGHKSDAILIPHTSIGLKIAEVTTDKNARIHLYCAAGVRAGMAKRTLENMGYSNVINEGGLSDVQ